MLIKTPLNRLYPTLAAVLIVTMLVAVAWSLMSSRRAELQTLRASYQATLAAGSWVTPQDIQATLADADTAANKISTDSNISDLLAALGQDLEANQLLDHKMTTGRPTGEILQKIPIQLRFKGNFESTCRLLERLDRYPTLVRVDQMRLQRVPNDPTAQLDIELGLSTFVGDLKGIKP